VYLSFILPFILLSKCTICCYLQVICNALRVRASRVPNSSRDVLAD